MDPLSIASGIAGLVSLADLVITRTYNTIVTCKNASQDARRLLRETENLLDILQSVSDLELKVGTSTIQSRIPSRAVSDCQKTLQRIHDKLEKSDPKGQGSSFFRRVTRTLKWPISSSETLEFLAEMERHKSTFNLAMSADALNLLLASEQSQVAMWDRINQLAQSMQFVMKIEMMKESRRVLQIMGPDCANDIHRSYLRLHQPGMNVLVLDGQSLRDWCSTPNAKLWVSGKPGSGKTTLSAVAIQKALTTAPTTRSVVFLYCSFRDDHTRQLTGILHSLIRQLARQHEDCLAVIQMKFPSYGCVDTPPWLNNESDLIALLDALFLCFGQVRILIDGMDECYDAHSISKTLAHFYLTPQVQMMILSRQGTPMQPHLEDLHSTSIAADGQDFCRNVSARIESFVHKRDMSKT